MYSSICRCLPAVVPLSLLAIKSLGGTHHSEEQVLEHTYQVSVDLNGVYMSLSDLSDLVSKNQEFLIDASMTLFKLLPSQDFKKWCEFEHPTLACIILELPHSQH